MKVCPNCYARNYDNAEICFNCKTPLVNIPIVTNFNSQMNSQMQSNQKNYMPNIVQQKKQSIEPNKKNRQKKNSMVLILSILSCLLVITNVITLFFLINEKNKNSDNKSLYSQLAEIVEPNENQHPIEYQTLQFGQKLDIQEIDIQLDTTDWADIITIQPEDISETHKGDHKITHQDNPNEVYYYVIGSVRNEKGNEIDLSRSMLASFQFNDKYSYQAKFYCIKEKDDYTISTGADVRPLENAQLIIAVSVPNEIKENFDHCELTIGYNDNFEYINFSPIQNIILSDFAPTFEELDYVYQLHLE